MDDVAQNHVEPKLHVESFGPWWTGVGLAQQDLDRDHADQEGENHSRCFQRVCALILAEGLDDRDDWIHCGAPEVVN